MYESCVREVVEQFSKTENDENAQQMYSKYNEWNAALFSKMILFISSTAC